MLEHRKKGTLSTNVFCRAFETVLGSEKWSERLQRMRLPRRMTCDVWLPPSEQEQHQEEHSKEFQRLLEHHGFTTEQVSLEKPVRNQ